ncbi:hypothetical protein J2S74_005010 [Evansella vedderi]|uniref:Lipoprotein n=1 Tax=Evansella vedderi TaxID=38282 RepID=A0ABU0A235_9BACI|nr:hypothetical protein [Evansella vedderi]MDQ0257552.1 hypothetical protein [Evansella vedderi]
MKSFKLFSSIIAICLLFIVGCSINNLSEDEAITIALEFAKTNAQENNLNIPSDELWFIQSDRIDKKNKWAVYIGYPEASNSDEIKLPSLAWVSVSYNKKVLGYDFTPWGGEYEAD